MLDLARLTAEAMLSGMERKEFSSVELVKNCLAQVEAREPSVQAFAYIDPAYALAQAGAADDVRMSGRGVGPLNGLPIGIKDIIDTADQPTEHGFPAAFAGHQPREDAFLVAQLRAAGAVIMGKTVSSPLASPGMIKTRNPRDESRTPGTSSSGSAAPVGAAMVPVAVRTQTAGSVIRPASFCGVYGYKPTFGLISRRGVLLQSQSLDTIGVLARSVVDLALFTDAMAAHDPHDSVSFLRARPQLLAMAQSPVTAPPRFALVKSPFWDTAEPRVRQGFDELREALGDQCREIELNVLGNLFRGMQDIMAAENALHYGRLYDEHSDAMGELARASVERGRKISAQHYLTAIAQRDVLYEMFEREILPNYTAILTLSADGVAPKMDQPFTPNINGVWTFLRMPTVSLPLIEVDGLPVGVQLVGARLNDGRLLRTARWLTEHVASLTRTMSSSARRTSSLASGT
jgi:Asp-tRNA(Asn)/Glu-tRNA(Gln) amidotransferase A subunit family amidase